MKSTKLEGVHNKSDPQRTMPLMVFDEEVGHIKSDPQRTMPVMVFDEEVGHIKSEYS